MRPVFALAPHQRRHMRRDRAAEALEIVAALQQRNDAPAALPLRDRHAGVAPGVVSADAAYERSAHFARG
jgi:hypothetical protein